LPVCQSFGSKVLKKKWFGKIKNRQQNFSLVRRFSGQAEEYFPNLQIFDKLDSSGIFKYSKINMIKFLSKIHPQKFFKKTALLRLDLNIQDNEIKNSLRLQRSLATIIYLLHYECKVVILSHKGRPTPKDQKNFKLNLDNFDKKLSLLKISKQLSLLLGQKIKFFNNFDFKKIREDILKSPQGSQFLCLKICVLMSVKKKILLFLLENLHPVEIFMSMMLLLLVIGKMLPLRQ